jgi:hypothetical protein
MTQSPIIGYVAENYSWTPEAITLLSGLSRTCLKIDHVGYAASLRPWSTIPIFPLYTGNINIETLLKTDLFVPGIERLVCRHGSPIHHPVLIFRAPAN